MLLRSYQLISQILDDQNKVNKVENFLKSIRKTDIVTSISMSLATGIDIDESKNILALLASKGVLKFFIVVECTNPDIRNEDDIHHYIRFESIEEFNNFSTKEYENLCDCGYEYDFKNAKVGFKICRGVTV